MPSTAQFAANRVNCLSSTGPKSDQGKAASSLNAITHGFYSKAFVVADGEQSDFDELQQQLHENYEPDDADTIDLFQQILHSSWNLFRLRRLENQIYAASPNPFADPAAMRQLDGLRRHKGHFERALRAARKDYSAHVTNSMNRTAVPPDIRDAIPEAVNMRSFQQAHITKWKLYQPADFVRQSEIDEYRQRCADAKPTIEKARADLAADRPGLSELFKPAAPELNVAHRTGRAS